MKLLLGTGSIALAVWLIGQALFLMGILQVLGRVHVRRGPWAKPLITNDGPPLHERMPEFAGADLDGNRVRLSGFLGRPVLLLVLEAGCAPCRQVFDAAPALLRTLRRPPALLALLGATRKEAATIAARRTPLIVDEGGLIRERLGIGRTPYGLLLDSEGVVRMKGVVSDRHQLEGLAHGIGKPMGDLGWHVSLGADEDADQTEEPASAG